MRNLLTNTVLLIAIVVLLLSGWAPTPVYAQDAGNAASIQQTSERSTTNQDRIKDFSRRIEEPMEEAIDRAEANEAAAAEAGSSGWSVSLVKIAWAFGIFLFAYLFLRFLTRVLETLAEQKTQWRLTIKAIIPVIRIFSWTAVIFFITAYIFAPPIETVVALTASAGIAVGFAAQDILKNIFGGIIILFDRPFQVGDKIEIGGHYGEVVSIGLRTARILTPDDSLVSVPNSELINQSVLNSNKGDRSAMASVTFYLPPGIDMYKVRKVALRAAVTSRFVNLRRRMGVSFANEIHEGRSMIRMRLLAYVFDHRNEFKFRTEATEIVLSNLIHAKLVKPEDLALTGK